jgi:hypothetical protein
MHTDKEKIRHTMHTKRHLNFTAPHLLPPDYDPLLTPTLCTLTVAAPLQHQQLHLYPHPHSFIIWRNRYAGLARSTQRSGNMPHANMRSQQKSASYHKVRARDTKRCRDGLTTGSKLERYIQPTDRNVDEGEVVRDSCMVM